MDENKHTLTHLVYSDDPSVIGKLKALLSELKSDNKCEEITDLKNTSSHSGGIIYFSDTSKPKETLRVIQHKFTDAPIIYLQTEQSPKEIKDLLKIGAQDILDMSRVTKNGLERTFQSAIERHHIVKELNDQKTALTEIIQTMRDDEYNDNSLTSADDNKDLTNELIHENKRLLKTVLTQNNELKDLSRNDPLTKIANRLQFEETLEQLMANAERHNHILAMLFIDLNKFKNINDTLGHQIGDKVLIATAERLKKVLRKSDFIARLGGDEFAIILPEVKSTHAAGIVAWKLCNELKKHYEVDGHQIEISASIGIGCYPMIGEDRTDLIKHADVAMYEAKKARIDYKFATIELQNQHLHLLKIDSELKHAIDNQQFHLVYQPILDLPSCKLKGFEALLRWDNPSLGIIPPDQFIPIAEDSGLILQIGEWVLETACRQVSQWSQQFDFPYKICINLSPIQLNTAELLVKICKILKANKLPASLLEFELTEMALLNENETAEINMDKLFKLGATHALDDFGTGYSSLVRLKHLPITTLKIDKTFVQSIPNASDTAIIKTIISLAKKLGLKTVAEGIETEEQLKFLIQENCDSCQGYYFYKPMITSKVTELLKEYDSNKQKRIQPSA